MADGYACGYLWQGSKEFQNHFWTTGRIESSLKRAHHPLRLHKGRTHFGSIKSLSQASSEFSSTTCLNVAERTRANEGLDILVMNRIVGRVS